MHLNIFAFLKLSTKKGFPLSNYIGWGLHARHITSRSQ
jgi:hypothetical protein